MQQREIDYVLKLIVIGDSGTGKSSLIYRFLHGERIHFR